MAKKRHYDSGSRAHMRMGQEDGPAIVSPGPAMVDEGNYSGEKARRMMEMHDAGMIHEDRSAIANLPQNVMIKPYPKMTNYLPEDLDDTIRAVDGQMDLDNSQRRRNFMPKKV
jgi:hypothetical protein